MSASSTNGAAGGDGLQTLTPSLVNIVRLAMLAGSLLFGVIAWYLTSSGQVEPSMSVSGASTLRLVFYLLLASSLVGIWLMRQRADRTEAFPQRAKLLILGYALAEVLVFFGAVYLLLTGNATLFLGGLLVFMLAFLLLPLQPASAR